MRFGVGLLALLVVVAIVMLMYGNYMGPVAQKGTQAREQAEQIAGVDASGGRVSDSYDLDSVMEGGKLRGLRVTRISSTSPMKTYYGLQKDDLIVEYSANGVMFKTRETDSESARAWIAQAYQTKQPLVVLRNGAPITLDGEAKKPAPPGTPSAGSGGDSMQDQLNKVKTPR